MLSAPMPSATKTMPKFTIYLFLNIFLLSSAWGADWRRLPSPPEYQAMVDLDTVKKNQHGGIFTLRRAYPAAQTLADGKEYHSTRQQYVINCGEGHAALAATAYYGADRKLVRADMRPKWKSDLAAPAAESELANGMKLACERLATLGDGDAATKKAEPAPSTGAKPAVARSSSGSGIVISRNGHILTNQHVVRQCDAHEIIDDKNRVLKAELGAIDVAKDLALLTVSEKFSAAAPVRKAAEPRLGEAVTVVGYPLVGVLGTKPSVGFGHVSSTVGVRGNPVQMQISVPIQRGNSGGPVLDQAGNLIGVVVSKLDALKLAQRTGDLPQNVNFAIKGESVRTFLESNKIEFEAAEDTARLENTEIASRGAAVTVRVRCIRNAVPVAAQQ
jgi:S1-C subfamily serine protease